jgi:nucleotide-binding universal stress UspA family protein
VRLILAIDYSDHSANAVEGVARRRWPEGTAVCVVAAVPRIPPSAAELWFDAAGSLEEVWELRRERARELTVQAAQILRTAGLATETGVFDGSLTQAVQTQAANWPADLVIMGSLPCWFLPRWQAGRIKRRLAGDTRCSVEVFRSNHVTHSIIAT